MRITSLWRRRSGRSEKIFVDEYLYDIQKAGIHSYRYRTKEPGHLLEKIIRKRRENFRKFDRIDRWEFFTNILQI